MCNRTQKTSPFHNVFLLDKEWKESNGLYIDDEIILELQISFSNSMTNNFEVLPDEILLLICRYLSSTDILYSFYGLNDRLSRTINDYRRYVVLGEVPLTQFNLICKSILPKIGDDICSLVVSNDWKGVLSRCFSIILVKQCL